MTSLPWVVMRVPLFRGFFRGSFVLSTTIRREDTPTFVQNWNFQHVYNYAAMAMLLFSFHYLYRRLIVCEFPCLKLVKTVTLKKRNDLFCSDTFYGQCKHGDIFGLHLLIVNYSAIVTEFKMLALSSKLVF